MFGRSNDAFVELEPLNGINSWQYIKVKQHLGQRQLHLDHGESHANANARSQTERHVAARMALDFGRKASRIKLVRIGAPMLRIVVQCHDVDGDIEIFGQLDAI